MAIQKVVVRKEYAKGSREQTILGIMEIEAETLEEAQENVEDLMNHQHGENLLKTTDPRIKWEKLNGDGWRYIDYTFEVEFDTEFEEVELPKPRKKKAKA